FVALDDRLHQRLRYVGLDQLTAHAGIDHGLDRIGNGGEQRDGYQEFEVHADDSVMECEAAGLRLRGKGGSDRAKGCSADACNRIRSCGISCCNEPVAMIDEPVAEDDERELVEAVLRAAPGAFERLV